jgi:hypothetical protein
VKVESLLDLMPDEGGDILPGTATARSTPRPPTVTVARAVAPVMTGLFVFIGVRVGLERWTGEIVVLLALLGVASVGCFLAWWRAWTGGLALVLAGTALALFFGVRGGDDRLLLVAVFALPYLLSGLLLWLGSTRSVSDLSRR